MDKGMDGKKKRQQKKSLVRYSCQCQWKENKNLEGCGKSLYHISLQKDSSVDAGSYLAVLKMALHINQGFNMIRGK